MATTALATTAYDAALADLAAAAEVQAQLAIQSGETLTAWIEAAHRRAGQPEQRDARKLLALALPVILAACSAVHPGHIRSEWWLDPKAPADGRRGVAPDIRQDGNLKVTIDPDWACGCPRPADATRGVEHGQ